MGPCDLSVLSVQWGKGLLAGKPSRSGGLCERTQIRQNARAKSLQDLETKTHVDSSGVRLTPVDSQSLYSIRLLQLHLCHPSASVPTIPTREAVRPD